MAENTKIQWDNGSVAMRESPSIQFHVSADWTLIAARLGDANVFCGNVQRFSVELVMWRDDGVKLAHLYVNRHQSDDGQRLNLQESCEEIASALLWSHWRSMTSEQVDAWVEEQRMTT